MGTELPEVWTVTPGGGEGERPCMEMRDEQVSRLSKEEVRLTMTKVYSH